MSNSNSFGVLNEVIKTMKNVLKETENEVNSIEVEEVKELLQKYNVVLKDDIDEKNLILKYQKSYNKLNEFVINKRKQIENVEEAIKTLSGLANDDNFTVILNKKKSNINQIIDCVNQIVERIIVLETTIYNNRVKELDNMKVQKYGVVKEQIKQMKTQEKQPIKTIKTNDKEMDVINNSMSILKKWSNKKTSSVIFDSKANGNGDKNSLYTRIFGRSNLYFISFDDNNNVYGGYVNDKINKSGDLFSGWIYDNDVFVFSLIRDGKINTKKYDLKQGVSEAFLLFDDDQDGRLYNFGNDIWVYKIGSNQSCCISNEKYCWYDYKNDNKPFTDVTRPHTFGIKRIVVIQMK